jgi:hypothetical protein
MWSFPRPEGLNDEAWRAITSSTARLHDSREREDISAAIGAAKELCESVARVILAQRGHSLGSNASYDEVINAAHKAIERQPGTGLAADQDVRRIAQGAKTIACALGPMRNQRGTGHGRSHPPDVQDEHALIACDAAFLWCRWALRRLGPYILGDVSALVNKLQQDTFYKGDLTERLAAVDLAQCADHDAHLLGLAVGQRTSARHSTSASKASMRHSPIRTRGRSHTGPVSSKVCSSPQTELSRPRPAQSTEPPGSWPCTQRRTTSSTDLTHSPPTRDGRHRPSPHPPTSKRSPTPSRPPPTAYLARCGRAGYASPPQSPLTGYPTAPHGEASGGSPQGSTTTSTSCRPAPVHPPLEQDCTSAID